MTRRDIAFLTSLDLAGNVNTNFAGFAWGLGRNMAQVGIIAIGLRKRAAPKHVTSKPNHGPLWTVTFM